MKCVKVTVNLFWDVSKGDTGTVMTAIAAHGNVRYVEFHNARRVERISTKYLEFDTSNCAACNERFVCFTE